MKKAKSSKLMLNKENIATISRNQMQILKGGDGEGSDTVQAPVDTVFGTPIDTTEPSDTLDSDTTV